MLTLAVALIIAAEWPRLGARFGSRARATRARSRRKREFTVIEGEREDDRGDDDGDDARSRAHAYTLSPATR